MSVYRRKYQVKKRGAPKGYTSRFYTVEFRAPDGSLVRRSTKCTTRRAAEAAELEIRKEVEGGHVGFVGASEARRGYRDHVDEFIGYLLTDLDRDADYCRIAKTRLNLMARESGWQRLSDVSLASFESWRRAQDNITRHGRKPKPKTINQYLDILRRFLTWARKRGKIKANPLMDAEKAGVTDNRNYRRAGTPEEFAKLLAAVGPERRRFYRWAIFVPLRRRTHEALEWADVHERDAKPWVSIRGETIKDKKSIHLPLRKDVAEMMAKWRAELKPKPHDKVWAKVPELKEIQADMKAAGVEFKNAKGEGRLDLHAFRKTALRWMKQAGVPIEDAAAILQHKDIRTTRRYYDEDPDPMGMDVVEKMPPLPDVGGAK